MRRKWLAVGLALVVLAVVGTVTFFSFRPAPEPHAMLASEVAAPPPPTEIPMPSLAVAEPVASIPGGPATPGPLAVSVPQIAYVYKLGYILPGGSIAAAQEAHLALCTRLGPQRCQMVGMQRGGGESALSGGTLRLRVASALARPFAASLTKAVAGKGGREASTDVGAEDVSKDIVDTEARLRQRELLVARLTEILRTRQGKVGELVEAERSVAQAQEELDQARSWLAELRGRVALSSFEISYAAAAPESSVETARWTLSDSLRQSIAAFATGLQALLVVAIFLLPWAIVGLPIALLVRHRLRRAASGTIEDQA